MTFSNIYSLSRNKRMPKYRKEFIFWVLIVLPYVYLAFVWDKLPDKVPTHFSISGTADGWSDKSTLLWLPGGMGIVLYVLMLVIPSIDPKQRIQAMGERYYTFRLMLTLFFSFIATYLVYVSQAGTMERPGLLTASLGAMFAMLGNYFQIIRRNYFIGIRTPWTLESELVWKRTHHMAGRLWMAGGILIIILSLIISSTGALAIASGVLLFMMIIVPVVYSYTEFQKEKRIGGNLP